MALPQLPADMKLLSRYLKVAEEFDQRDPVVAYFCRFYAVQIGVQNFGKDKARIGLLMQLMDAVEQHKNAIKAKDPQALEDLVAKSKLWEVAMKLFSVADREDRADRITKSVARTFFTCTCLFDVLSLFGDEDEKTQEVHDYARWKAAYITRCFREGIKPQPGPVDADGNPQEEQGEDEVSAAIAGALSGAGGGDDGSAAAGTTFDELGLPSVPGSGSSGASAQPFSPPSFQQPPQQQHQPQQPPQQPQQPPQHHQPPQQPAQQPQPPAYQQQPPQQPPQKPQQPQQPPQQPQHHQPSHQPHHAQHHTPAATPTPQPAAGGTLPSRPKANVSYKELDQVAKHCKYVISALQYSDLPTAIANLHSALKLIAE